MNLLTPDRYTEYDAFLQSHPKGHFLQSTMWGKVKDSWKNEVLLCFDAEGKIRASMSVLIRKIPYLPFTLMYSPRGPVCDVHDRETIAELLSGARELAKKYKSYVLKIDPDVKSSDTELGSILTGLGFALLDAGKNFEGVQPKYVFRLDVSGRTEDEVFAGFESKTRYNIRLAGRKGVTVEIGTREDLPRFHEIMVETGERDRFITRPLSYFQKMYDELGDALRLYVARFEGKIIAATLAVCYGNKVWYVYGASSNEYRNVMPNYLLQWEMIRWAIERGCDIYDFRGVSGDLDESNPLYGLYRFKKGFNGEFTEFIGEYNYIFNKFIYWAVEKGEKTYRSLRYKSFLRKEKEKK